MLWYSQSTCSYVNNEAGWDLVYLIYKTRRQPVHELRIIHDYKWTRCLGSLSNTSSKWNACFTLPKNINEEINGHRAQRGILQYESPFGSVPTDPLPAWEKVGIFYSCYQEVFFLSCYVPAFGFSNGWTRWGFEKKHSNSNILIWLFWGGLLLFYRCVCMRQRGVCSAIFKNELLIFLTLSVSLIPAFIFYLFLTFFPAACRSLSFGIGFFQSFQNNYTTWSQSLHFLSFHLLCLSQWGWILL